jgi:uncharacterized protein YodC (DUF2158 family)
VFLPGDSVQVSHGDKSSTLTVIKHRRDDAVVCFWFFDKCYQEAAFDKDHLVRVRPLGAE